VRRGQGRYLNTRPPPSSRTLQMVASVCVYLPPVLHWMASSGWVRTAGWVHRGSALTRRFAAGY
jgi:hypothetical protein